VKLVLAVTVVKLPEAARLVWRGDGSDSDDSDGVARNGGRAASDRVDE
jgi:hypothetical protein